MPQKLKTKLLDIISTGKTRTAIGCMLEKMQDDEPLLVIVSTPQNTLSRQWADDIKALNIHFPLAETDETSKAEIERLEKFL